MPWQPDYVSTEELKAYLYVQSSDVADDVQLSVWCTAASRAVDSKANRQFGQLAGAAGRTYRRPAAYDVVSGLWLLEVDDLQDITGFTVNGQPYASCGAVLLPDNAPADGKPYERLGFTDPPDGPTVGVGRWGWDATPVQVTGAVKLQANRWNARRASPFGVAGSPDQGSEIRLLARLDPDVAPMLAGVMRRRQAG